MLLGAAAVAVAYAGTPDHFADAVGEIATPLTDQSIARRMAPVHPLAAMIHRQGLVVVRPTSWPRRAVPRHPGT